MVAFAEAGTLPEDTESDGTATSEAASQVELLGLAASDTAPNTNTSVAGAAASRKASAMDEPVDPPSVSATVPAAAMSALPEPVSGSPVAESRSRCSAACSPSASVTLTRTTGVDAELSANTELQVLDTPAETDEKTMAKEPPASTSPLEGTVTENCRALDQLPGATAMEEGDRFGAGEAEAMSENDVTLTACASTRTAAVGCVASCTVTE
mmetsp:Transcript_19299/g.73973  ORF Transcript_19299/g.73973 Transcript_19299/m.73973 type:complete len:211 (+) Transcript_19299:5821-6453(+)